MVVVNLQIFSGDSQKAGLFVWRDDIALLAFKLFGAQRNTPPKQHECFVYAQAYVGNYQILSTLFG